MGSDPNVRRLAREFSRLLVRSLGREKVLKIIRLNKAEKDPGVCHSHDFCDANMAMLEAHENLKLIPGNNREDVRRWNDAWEVAVKNGFFLR